MSRKVNAFALLDDGGEPAPAQEAKAKAGGKKGKGGAAPPAAEAPAVAAEAEGGRAAGVPPAGQPPVDDGEGWAASGKGGKAKAAPSAPVAGRGARGPPLSPEALLLQVQAAASGDARSRLWQELTHEVRPPAPPPPPGCRRLPGGHIPSPAPAAWASST